MPPEPRLQLFGSPCWCSGTERRELPDVLPAYLLAYLACHGGWVSRDALAGLFWPQRSDAEALHNLRANLHRARALLDRVAQSGALQAQARRVRVVLHTDVAAFRRALGRADWASGVDLQPAPLMASWTLRGFPLLEEWATAERAALAAAWRDAALRAALDHQREARADAAAAVLMKLLAAGEPAEDAVQTLLRVADAAGCRAEALRQHERLVQGLREAGLHPLPETLRLAHALRGRAVPLAAGAAARTADVPRVLAAPPLIGRDAERRLLADRRIGAVVVAGEPGVGKSHLLAQALPGAWWLACAEGLQGVPLAPLAELLEDQRDSLPALDGVRRELARLVPALLPGEQPPPADAATAKPRLLAAAASLLEARPHGVVFDDVQWADATTRELIVLLARRGLLPLRISYRSNEADAALHALLDALDSGGARHVVLAPLDEPQLLELLAALGAAAPPPLFGHWLHRHTGGNPFFAVQTLRALFESGRLVATSEGWGSAIDELTVDYSELSMPPRVATLVQRRVRALSAPARRVLDIAALVGDVRWPQSLAAAAGLSALACGQALAELQDAALLREQRFAHDLLRQAVVAAIAAPLRAALHGRIAAHFAEQLPDEVIAEHGWQAGRHEPALAAALRGMAVQRHAGLHAAALALAARAFGQTADSAARAVLHAECARIRLELAELEAAETSARAVFDEEAAPRTRADAWLVLAGVRMQRGQADAARAALVEAAACDPEHEALPVERARIAMLQGRVGDAVPDLELQCARLRARPPSVDQVRALSSLGAACDELGQPERGLPLHREAWTLAARLRARYAQVEVAVNLLWSLSALGRNDEAVALAEQALALGEYDSSATLRNNLAWCLRRLGRIEPALRLSEQLAAGSDPTLALIAHARVIELRAPDVAPADIDRLLERFGNTDVYLAHAAAAKTVLLHGSAAQVQRALPWLRAQPIDPALQAELDAALRARGVVPSSTD